MQAWPESSAPWPAKKTAWRQHLLVRMRHGDMSSSHADIPDMPNLCMVVLHTASGSQTEPEDHTMLKGKEKWIRFKKDAFRSAIRCAKDQTEIITGAGEPCVALAPISSRV